MISKIDKEDLGVLLLNTQKEIANLNANPYYMQAYKNAETNYWDKIALWLYERRNSPINKVLDIGCAYGTLSLLCHKLFDSKNYCIDFLPIMSQTLISKYNFNFALVDFEIDQLPFGHEKFDVILLTEVLEHFNFHPFTSLKKMRDLLTDNGELFLSTPDATKFGRVTKYYTDLNQIPIAPSEKVEKIDDHIYQYYTNELLELLHVTGFKIKKFEFSKNGHFNIIAIKSDSTFPISGGV